MRIFIYDDNKTELKNLTQQIIGIVQKEKVNIDTSSSFIEDKIRINHTIYDIAIIVYNKKETLFLLKVLMHRNKDCKIIVIGNEYSESQYAYEVKAYQFLLKEELSMLEVELIRLVNMYKKENIQMILYMKDEIKKIFIKDILYIEFKNKMIIVHCVNEQWIGKVKNPEKLKKVLMNMNFIHIHQSYLISIKNILSFRRGEVTLKNNETLPVSLKYRSFLKEKMNGFYQLG